MDATLLLHLESNHGIMDEEDDLGSLSSFSDDDLSVEDGSATSASSATAVASDDDGLDDGHLYDMSNLMAQLPLRRGLSKFYDGKSQSFTSLANVKFLEDLPKTERRSSSSCKQRKLMKTSKSCGGMSSHRHQKQNSANAQTRHNPANIQTNIYSKTITKKPSRKKHLFCHSSVAAKSPFSVRKY